MPIFNFNPPEGLLNQDIYPTNPANENEARGQVMSPLNQLRDFINSYCLIVDGSQSVPMKYLTFDTGNIRGGEIGYLTIRTINGVQFAIGSDKVPGVVSGGRDVFLFRFDGTNARMIPYQSGAVDLGESNLAWRDIYLDVSSDGTNGCTKLPNGFILQWGTVSAIPSGSSTKVTFPVAFPSACRNIQLTANGSTGSAPAPVYNTVTASSFNIAQASGSTLNVNWVAIGK